MNRFIPPQPATTPAPRNFSATIKVPFKVLLHLNQALQMNHTAMCESFSYNEDELIHCDTARFANGYEMDIKVYNGVPGATPWVDSILYDETGREVSCCEGEEKYNTTYILKDYDNTHYQVTVTPAGCPGVFTALLWLASMLQRAASPYKTQKGENLND